MFVEILLGVGTFGWTLTDTTGKHRTPPDESTDFVPWRDAIDDSQKEFLLGTETFGNTAAKYPLPMESKITDFLPW